MTHSPLIRQAASDVDAARGAMIQAGAYPNPHLGYECDNINTGRTAGYQGGNISQTIVTGGKLRLARAAAEVDVENAELALRRRPLRSGHAGAVELPGRVGGVGAYQGQQRPERVRRTGLSHADQPRDGRPGGPLRTFATSRAGRHRPRRS